MKRMFLSILLMLFAFPALAAPPAKADPSATGTPVVTKATRAAAVKVGEGQKVNINTATLTELEMLPGVGPTLAQAIVSYRETNGGFKTPEDLLKVPGIRERRFATLKAWVIADDKAKQAGRDPGIIDTNKR